jgi:hypothetical protein
MTAQITSLLDLKKELQKNFAELKIDLSERTPTGMDRSRQRGMGRNHVAYKPAF